VQGLAEGASILPWIEGKRRVALKIRKDRLLIGLIATMLLIAGLAWRDAGHEPVHEISEPIDLPAGAK
jgi:hypothetical protein